jgi:hypothetical protein
LNADDARDAHENAWTRFLGALGGGRGHFIGERGSRKKRDASRPDCDFAQNLHRYLRSRWLVAMRKQPEMRSAVPCKKHRMHEFRQKLAPRRFSKVLGRQAQSTDAR